MEGVGFETEMTKRKGMSRFCRRVVWMALLVCASATSAQGQLGEILNQMASPDLNIRGPAARKLISSPAMLNTRAAIQALVELLERENALVLESHRRGQGASQEYGEEYSNYYGELLGAVFEHGDHGDERTLRALARGAYNPDSEFTRDLASAGGSLLVAPARDLFEGDVLPHRENGLALIGLLYEHREEHGITGSAALNMKATILQAAEQRSIMAQAVQILGRVGDRQDLPLLRRIAADERNTSQVGQLPSVAAIANDAVRAILLRDPGLR